MPDPLCRFGDSAVLLGRTEDRDDFAERLTRPDELRGLCLGLGLATRRLRGLATLSQEALGDRASLHRNYIGAFERGELNPTLRTACQVAHALRLPTSDLLAAAERLAAERRRRQA
jgi:DNA-binding XRE family transcriptional regulator